MNLVESQADRGVEVVNLGVNRLIYSVNSRPRRVNRKVST